jgi:nitrate reductase (cytochrome), electron transfer subunit
MSPLGSRASALLLRLFLLASTVTAIGALAVAARRVATRRAEPVAAVTPQPILSPPDEPIASEAGVFRTSAAVLAISPTPGPRRSAHPRTLARYRFLRAYPGAPPRIPHGLAPSEFRTGGCNTCHERGGYSQRFEAYVPVTPHPEMGACLTCHVGNAQLMAIPLPNVDPSTRCRQCHLAPGGGARWVDSTLDWKTMAWPEVKRVTRDSAPPPIPHALEMRTNCLACHSAPSAVEEIRTSHPERANCRQCHLTTDADTGTFSRLRRDVPGGKEGRS